MNITLITGATKGLGKELAKLYLKDGNDCLLISSNINNLKETKEELQKEYKDRYIDIYEADLSDTTTYKKIVEYVKEKGYFVNNLVNSAGFGDCHDLKDMDPEFNVKLNNVNCNALYYLTQAFGKIMLERNEGHIINVSSIAGFVPGPFMCTYHASKAYVLNLGDALAREFKGTNVKILTLCPGPFESNFVAVAHNDYTFKKIKPKTAKEVAEYGYKMSLKGKSLKVVGFKNKITVFLPRFFSHKFVANISATQIKNTK